MVFEVGGGAVLWAFVADSKKKSLPRAHFFVVFLSERGTNKQWRVFGERREKRDSREREGICGV